MDREANDRGIIGWIHSRFGAPAAIYGKVHDVF